MNDDVTPRRFSLDEDQRRIAAASDHDRERRNKREQLARALLQNSAVFSSMMEGHGVEEERTRQLVLEAVARELAKKPIGPEFDRKALGQLIEATAPEAHQRERLEREQALQREIERQKLEQARQSDQIGQQRQNDDAISNRKERSDYFARNEPHIERNTPKAQWLGKYQTLDETTRQLREAKIPASRSTAEGNIREVGNDLRGRTEREDVTQRQQREESDRQQSPAIESSAREQRSRTDQHHPLAAGETKAADRRESFTPRGQDRSPDARPHTQEQGRGGRGGRSR